MLIPKPNPRQERSGDEHLCKELQGCGRRREAEAAATRGGGDERRRRRTTAATRRRRSITQKTSQLIPEFIEFLRKQLERRGSPFNASVSTAFNNIKAHLSRIGCLQLYLNAVKFSLEPVLRACIDHFAPHPCKNSALLAIFCCHKIKIIDSVSAFISREACCEIFITFSWFSQLFHHNLLLFLLNFVNDEAKGPLCLQV
ncbi:hypothetical protein Ccrd_014707 [Cynara cardunculus var. scolymus]|uniref:Uncharacterized protein n=1 Tax=Cynara cardunculus var. scolymus TaxID=59895 RepID=A0A103YD66_CYNCS|nr:hypothetical protein Ccrd_014707 [Cynara cardunculus var. scolymus]